jgi:hypothetical protein
MKLGTVTQQPTERLSYTIDYRDALTDGDNVQTAFAVVTPAGLLVDNVSPLDPRVRFWATGGTAGTTYKVEITTSTADGRVFQDEVIFKIKEV